MGWHFGVTQTCSASIAWLPHSTEQEARIWLHPQQRNVVLDGGPDGVSFQGCSLHVLVLVPSILFSSVSQSPFSLQVISPAEKSTGRCYVYVGHLGCVYMYGIRGVCVDVYHILQVLAFLSS